MSAELILIQTRIAGRAASPFYSLPALEALRSSMAFSGLVASALFNAVIATLLTLAILVLLRLIVRRTWLASMALALLAVPISAAGTSVFDVVVAVSFLSLTLIVLLRAGVIAHVAMGSGEAVGWTIRKPCGVWTKPLARRTLRINLARSSG